MAVSRCADLVHDRDRSQTVFQTGRIQRDLLHLALLFIIAYELWMVNTFVNTFSAESVVQSDVPECDLCHNLAMLAPHCALGRQVGE
jgi:hypothetical protein